jgi:hypothetical protein
MARKTSPTDNKKSLFIVAQHKDDLPGSCFVYKTLEEALELGPAELEVGEGNSIYVAEVLMGSVHEYTLKLTADICRRVPDSEVTILSEDLSEKS